MSLNSVFAKNKSENNKSGSNNIKQKNKKRFFGAFLNYESAENKLRNSALAGILLYVRQKNTVISRVKHEISASVEKSTTSTLCTKISGKLLAGSMRSYGVCAFIFGIVILLICALKSADNYMTFDTSVYGDFSSALIITFVSVAMMFSGKSIGSLITESKIMSFLFFRILCFDRKMFDKKGTPDSTGIIAVIIGCLLGIATIAVSPFRIIVILFCVPIVAAVLRTPEIGIILAFLLLPFLPDNLLYSLAALCCISVIFKVIRNKRVLKFGLFDSAVVMFAAVVLLGGVNSPIGAEGFGDSVLLLMFLLLGWILTNTMKTTELTKKCIEALRISVTVVSAVGILIFVLGLSDVSRENAVLAFADSLLRSIPFAPDNSYSILAAVMIPFSFAAYRSGKGFGLISLVLCFSYAVLSLDVSVWICCVLAVVLYFCFKSPILFAYFGGVLAIILILIGIAPSVFDFVHDFIHSFSNHEVIMQYTPVANENAVKLIKEFMWCGAGTGENVLNHLYSCIFGYDASKYIDYTSYPLSLLLRFGVVGALCLIVMLFVFISNCMSLYYTDKFCKTEMKNYAMACASSVVAVIAAETIFPMALSTQMVLCMILLMYIPVSIRKSAKNEYVPESYELDIDD